MKSIAILSIILLLSITIIPSFSQTGSRDIMSEYCQDNWQHDPVRCADFIPEGYGERVAEITQNKFTSEDEMRRQQLAQNPDLKCPSGTYYGLDNQGNPACRDTQSNQIVDPNTGMRYDSQTGDVVLQDEQIGYVVIGVIIFIIIIAVIAKTSQSKSEPEYTEKQSRRSFGREIESQTLRKQDNRCNDCGRRIGLVNGRLVYFDYDHIDGRSWNTDPSNCQALCKNCHTHKTERERNSNP
ncbi:HNH endonuclease signature motif containing protein [Nitrosopumilus ureiphilus]|uniref:HNH nuclease domain-containing protein n=1 Tax=Nitrosopumilus ureiphilus TaxID=1470067 RepID=A0A7D5M8D7_9ARCH|nr:HNH endonuclease signature motif containing protein [Nitrosopumilus ureiphilus]QLH06968.1 hypothetical protein C5F50_07700 [Nitrosopumilus ureiphilus]